MSNDNAISIIGNQNTQITDGNSSLIIAGNGNDNLTAGTNSVITAGNGSDTIAAAAGSAIAVGNGNDNITDGADGLIAAGNGNDLITTGASSIVLAGSGIDTVNAGDSSSIAIGDGNDTIRSGANSLIVAGNGSDALTAGANSTINAGNGIDTLIAGNNSVIAAGNGNDTVVVGASSTIVVGNGKDILTAGSGSSITAGSGSDTIHMGANDKVTVGGGADSFVLPTSGQVTLSAPTSVTVNEDGSVALAIAAASTGFGFGNESIAGFNPAKDSIVVYSSQFANFATILADAKQIGQNTVITGDAGDTITLQGVKLSSLTASDFTFLTTPISISISGIPVGVTLSDTAGAIAVTNGSATLTPAQLAGLKLTAGEVASANLTVTTTDLGTGASVSKTIALTVNPVAPTLTTPASLSVNADGVVALGITETPFDSRDTVSLKIAGVPSDATLSAGIKNSDGSWTLTPAQLGSLSLTAGNPTTTTLTVTATNTEGVTAVTQKTIQLSVLATLKVTFDTVAFSDTGVQGDHITNNNSVTLSGTVTDSLSVTQVQVLNGTTPVGNAIINNANHTWSLTTNLPDGNYNHLSVKAVDSVGNTASAATTQYVQVDTVAPVVSQSESVSGLTSSKADIVTVSVTDQVGVASVVIYDDQTGQKLGNATLAGSTWTYSAAGLTDGIHKFYAIVTDIAGNTTKTVDLPPVTVDTAPPTASATGSVSGLTNQTSETITVKASDAYGIASVIVEDNGVAIGTAAQTSPGVYALTANNLSQSSHDFTAVVTNLAGDQTTTNAIISTVDTTPPTLVSQTEAFSGLTSSKTDLITVNATDANGVASVAVYDDVTGQKLGNATLASGSTWTYNAANLADGTHKFYAVITDDAGNMTKTADLTTVTVDTTPPTASATGSVSGLTNQTSETITVNAADAVGIASVAVHDGSTLLGNATQTAPGVYSLAINNLSQGSHDFTAVVTDNAGNQTTTNAITSVVDTTPPTLVSQTESISGLTQSKTDLITVNATDANGVASVAIYDDATGLKLGNATLASGSTWTYNAANLVDGTHKFYAVITDDAGNTTKTVDLTTVTVDTTPPTASITGSVSGPTHQTSETITVAASDANGIASVVIDDNGAAIGFAAQTTPGVYALTESNVAQGNHDFTAVVTDNAGNVTTSNQVTSLVDTTPPTITFDTVSYDHTGTANFTKDPAVTMSGTTSDNVTVAGVQVFNGSQLLGTATVDNVAHTWTLTTNLAQGTYANLNAIATDEAGNTGAAVDTGAVQSLQVDTTAPTATLDHVTTGVLNDGITDNNLVTFSGTAADNVSITQVEVLNGNQVLGNATIDTANHTWSLSTNLADGTYANLKVEAIDEAGNTTIASNSSATQSVQIDTAPPVITFTGVVLTDPAGGSATVTNDGLVTLSGSVTDAISLSQVEVYNGTQLLGTAVVANGTWTLATTLPLGNYNQLHATATDIAGNTADASSQHIVTVAAATGQVTDGYISGATVFADAYGTGVYVAGEAEGVTDKYGHFTLGPGTTTGNLVMTGGIDTSTGLAFTGVLTAPLGSTQVTPLTTLVDAVAAANGGNVAAASVSVATALGISSSVDLTTTDPLSAAYAGDSQVFVAASKVLNTVSMVASAVSGSGASDFATAATNAFSALATQIVSNTGTLDLNSSATVTDVVDSTLAATSSSSLTSAQTADIATVVTNVNTATDQAVSDSSGSSTATLLTNVSATSIVAQGSTSTALQQATSGSGNLSTVVADNTGTALSSSVTASVSSVGNVAPAPPTFVSLTPTDASPNNLNLVHYTLSFSDPVTDVSASDFSLTTSGLTGASIASITPLAGSNGAQYTVAVNAGVGDGTLALNFTGTGVQDLAGNSFADQATYTGTAYVIDQDTAEQSALFLHVTNTQINSAGSAVFNFTIGGLDSDDSGTVTFTDGVNSVSVAVTSGQTAYTANLGALSDGPITSSLVLATDAAGNSFTPVAGTSAVVLSGVNVVNGVASNNGTLQVVQNGIGDITVDPTGPVVGTAGDGVIAEQSASGSGNITVDATGSTAGTGTGSVGLLAENLNAANTGNISITATGGASGAYNGVEAMQDGNGNVSIEVGGAITGSSQYGVWAITEGSGSESIVVDAGATINAASSGVIINDRDIALAASAHSSVTATNNGTINSGATNGLNGSAPVGLGAGYNGSSALNGVSTPDLNANGSVFINNNGSITAAGYGIEGFDFGNGNITINDAAGTSVAGGQYGIGAFDESKGAGSIAINVGANATVTATSFIGIDAISYDVGNVGVITATGDSINSGGAGINAVDDATSVAASVNSTITVIANGSITSGVDLTNGSNPNGINVGYLGGLSSTVNNNVDGNVVVQSNADIVAAANIGINAFNYGTGNVTVTTGAASSISAPGTGINANGLDGGNVSVTNAGSIAAATGIYASADKSGNVTVENDGHITATAFSGINVTDNAVGSTGSVTITNTGTVVGAPTYSSINVNANATGEVTIDNTGFIGESAVATNTPAITENGGGPIIINNSGQIDGGIFTNSTGQFTGTFNNESGATWNAVYLGDDGNIIASGMGSSIAAALSTGITVGVNATGNMTIEAGAMLTGSFLNVGNNTGSAGVVTATGAGSEISVTGSQGGANVGFNGHGSMLLEAGAAFVADFLNIGQDAGSIGAVTVTGPGTTVNTTTGQYQNVAVGFEGAASLSIANHATVTTTGMDVGVDAVAGVTDTVDINGGTLTVGSYLTVGDAGTGSLTIENGGVLNTEFLTVGSQAGSTGSLTVSGEGSSVQSTNLFIVQPSSSLTVDNGAVVDINGTAGNNGNITVSDGILDITNFLSGAGAMTLAAGGTIELGGASAENVVFNGGNDTLQLNNTGGYAGTIDGTASAPGTSTITGNGSIYVTAGDAIDFTAAGGGVGNQANVVISPSGNLTGAVNGIDAVQNSVGDITINSTGFVLGEAGDGIIAEQNATGSGNIIVDATASLTGIGTGSEGLLAENLNAASTGNIAITATGGASGASYGIEALQDGSGNVSIEAGGNITGTAQYGVWAITEGSGSESIVIDAGSTIDAASNGVIINDRDTVLAASADSSVTVTNNGTINSGTTPALNGTVPTGLGAGYNGSSALNGVSTPDLNANGSVFINNNGTITSGGYGIEGFNYVNGNITINDAAGTSVAGGQYGIGAFDESKGAGTIAIDVGADATITSTSFIGIQAISTDVGSIDITMSAGDAITSGGAGINAIDQATSIAASVDSTITIIANGTIETGTTITNGSNPNGINAVFEGGTSPTINSNVAGSVLVQSDANIAVAVDIGINADTYGTGNVTVATGSLSSIAAPVAGTGVNANALDGGNVSVTNAGSITAGTGIYASADKSGSVTIENDGHIIGTAFSGINVTDNAAGSTGSATITNTGTVVGAPTYSSINVNANATGEVTIDNTGFIGESVVAANTPAITENGGGSIIINNSGEIDGGIYTNNTGGFTGTFNNEAGATWNAVYLGDDGDIIASGTGSSIVGALSTGITVGNNANGSMTIEAGAMLTGGFLNVGNNAGSTGVVTATGVGSDISIIGAQGGANVGFNGSGTMLLEAGAAFVADFLNIGQDAGSQGSVTVTGAGSSINTNAGQYQNIAVGFLGAASLSIANGATVTTTGMDVGIDAVAGITDTLDINGGALNVGTYLTIGDAGAAIATIENGGSLTTGGLTVGNQAGSTASLTVSGAGSVVQTAGFGLGNNGSLATLNVDNGAVFDVNGGMNDAGTINISGGTLKISGYLSGSGPITLATGGTLEVGGTASQTVAFNGGNDTLQIDNNSGIIGTLTATSSAAGTSTITGAGNITSIAGDAIDFTAAGGTAGNPANIVLSPGGLITGAANGINAIQNAVGDITINSTSAIFGQAGDGVIAEQSATGGGNITIDATGSLTGIGTGSEGLLAENLNAANPGNITVTATGGASGAYNGVEAFQNGSGNVSIEAGGAITGSSQYGVWAISHGSGSDTIVTDAGSTINSASGGVIINNRDLVLAASADSVLTVTNNGTINSGATPGLNGSAPVGLAAGYNGSSALNGPSVADTNVNGTVIVNNNGTITAAGYGMEGFNFGNGNITLNDAAGTSVSGGQYGIAALDESKGAGSIAINVGADAAVTATSFIGVDAVSYDIGSVSVTTAAGDVVKAGGEGVNAIDEATSIAASVNSTITVIANGTIDSGTDFTNGASPNGINAGYLGGLSTAVNNNVHGNVDVESNAAIVAAANIGINAFNYGTGSVTVTTGATSSISAPGTGINANALDGGNVDVTNGGSITGSTGINASVTGSGSLTIENDGQITASAFAGINVTDNSTGLVTITNTGMLEGASTSPAISIGGGGTGEVTIDNAGVIDGSIYTNNTGGFTGIFNNNTGAAWNTGFLGDDGTITASGVGSDITVVGAGIGASIGDYATGSLTLEAGAVFSSGFLNIGFSAGSTGTVEVTGAGSELVETGTTGGVEVGFSGTGTLVLDAGASLVGDTLSIAQMAGSHGSVTVTGAGTTVNETSGQYQDISVGSDGTASLTIADHASIATTYMDVGINHDAGITDTLDINSGTLSVGGFLTIGDAGAVNATVENGGLLEAGGMLIGNQASAVANLTVDGVGSVVSTNNLSLGGNGGSADLTLTNGGAVDVGTTVTDAGAIHVGSGFNMQGSGTINGALVDDGYVSAIGTLLDVTGPTTGSGTLSISAGAHLELDSTVASTETVVFQNSQSGDTGSLILAQSSSFAALIEGFTGNGTLAGSDQIDLKDINYASLSETFIQGSGQTPNTLSLSDGTHSALLQFVGSYQQQNFSFASDGSGGTIVYDPPVANENTVGDKAAGMDHLAFNFDNLSHGGQPPSPLLFDELGMPGWTGNHPDSHQNLPGLGPGGWQALLQGHDAPIPDAIPSSELHANQFHYHLV